MMHFAQAGIALVAAGASVLIIGGLVRETLRDGGRHFHLFPDTHDHPQKPVPTLLDTAPTNDAGPFPHPRNENSRRNKRSRTRAENDRGSEPKKRKKQRRSKKRERGERHAKPGSRPTAAETEDA